MIVSEETILELLSAQEIHHGVFASHYATNVFVMLEDMEKRGLIIRVASQETGRRVMYRLTELGRSTHKPAAGVQIGRLR